VQLICDEIFQNYIKEDFNKSRCDLKGRRKHSTAHYRKNSGRRGLAPSAGHALLLLLKMCSVLLTKGLWLELFVVFIQPKI